MYGENNYGSEKQNVEGTIVESSEQKVNNSGNENPYEYYYTAGNGNNHGNNGYTSYGNNQYQQGNGAYGNFSGAYAGNNYSGNVRKERVKRPRKPHPFAKKAVTFVALGALLGVTAGAAFSVPTYITRKALLEQELEVAKAQQNANKTGLSTTTGSLTTGSSEQYTSDITAIANSCLPSVVSITNKGVTEVRTMFGTYQQDTTSSGSGIIIGENDTELLIVTNYHVVSGNSELSVVFSYDEDNENPSVVSAKLKGYDADKDLAVISVASSDITNDMRAQIKIATIGDSSDLQLGQQVVAIGNALGYGQSVTTGIISALNREVTVSDENGGTITNKLIQTDAAINPGNSGGALINLNGELIGINSVKVSNSSVEGMGYAIPISDVQSIIEELMLKETRDVVAEADQGYLGISGTDVTESISETYGMPIGIFINNVYDNSPAANAGLAKGNIITKFDGQTVKSMSEFKTLLTYYKKGETVKVVVKVQSSNGYEEKTVDVTLASRDIFGNDAEEQSTQNKNEQNQGSNNMNPYNFFWPFP